MSSYKYEEDGLTNENIGSITHPELPAVYRTQ
jgi:hypothetical protein